MPYKLQKTEDGYYVLREDGKRKNNKPMPRSRAVAYMRALYSAEKRTMKKEGEPEGEYKSDDYTAVILGVAKKHLKKNQARIRTKHLPGQHSQMSHGGHDMAPDKAGEGGGGSGSDTTPEQARYDKAKNKLSEIEKRIDENKAPFEGEITGGNVQMAAVGQWRHSRSGEAWNRRDDALRTEWNKAKEEMDAAKFALDKKTSTIAAGGKTAKKLVTALSWTKTPSIPPGMSFEGYRKAYNAAKKNGDNLSGYPTPDEMKKTLGLKEHTDQPGIFVFKQSNGISRWVTYSSNAFRDRDQEIVSTAALEADVERADKEGDYGPLRWWHVGKPDPFAKLPGAGADIGKCDYNAVHGRILVESGTFADERIAEAVKAKAHELQVSIGFFHPRNEPVGGVFSNIRRFERSLLPRGRASNPWTSMLVVQKEGGTMLKEKIQALKVLLGGDDELVQSVLEKAEQTQKAAEEAGIEFKGEDPQPEKVETPATEKAEVVDLTELADQETLEEMADEVSEADLEPVIGDMTPEEFSGMMAEALSKAIEPHVKEISKLKIAQSQKDDEAVSLKEALTLQAQTIAALKAQLDELTGSQPRAANKGYRASQAEETVVKSTSRVAGQKPTVDAGFLDFAIGKQP